ncbi:MAG: M15 family metallopeptidase [bacterium]
MSRDMSLLKPELQIIIDKFLIKCKEQGLPVLITQTFRTKSEQDALYAKGRNTSGNIITNVKYPNSLHCWGIACDFCRNVKGREYDDSDRFFEKCGAIGKSLGLEWGGDWSSFQDKPHLQLKIKVVDLIAKYGNPTNYINSWAEDKKVADNNIPSSWAKEAWEWAKKLKLIDGTNPKENITREEMILVLKRFADKK